MQDVESSGESQEYESENSGNTNEVGTGKELEFSEENDTSRAQEPDEPPVSPHGFQWYEDHFVDHAVRSTQGPPFPPNGGAPYANFKRMKAPYPKGEGQTEEYPNWGQIFRSEIQVNTKFNSTPNPAFDRFEGVDREIPGVAPAGNAIMVVKYDINKSRESTAYTTGRTDLEGLQRLYNTQPALFIGTPFGYPLIAKGTAEQGCSTTVGPTVLVTQLPETMRVYALINLLFVDQRLLATTRNPVPLTSDKKFLGDLLGSDVYTNMTMDDVQVWGLPLTQLQAERHSGRQLDDCTVETGDPRVNGGLQQYMSTRERALVRIDQSWTINRLQQKTHFVCVLPTRLLVSTFGKGLI